MRIMKEGDNIFDIDTYNPFEKTALKRKALSKPMKILRRKNLLQGKILDYACGYGGDMEFLRHMGYNIQGYDRYNPTYSDNKLLEGRYDTVTCLYMFNTIPSLNEHRWQLDSLRALSNNIYIAVRADNLAVNKKWDYEDRYEGWITSINSFQRFYDEDMIEKYFGEVDYIVNNSSMKLFKLR